MIDRKTQDTIKWAAESGELFAYFGYGSLVNRTTHRTETHGAIRAAVRGWRRHWQDRSYKAEHAISMLSVKAESDDEHSLPGLLVFDQMQNLPALDEREGGYDRRVVHASDIELEIDFGFEGPIFIYEARPPVHENRRHGILQSYLDAVLQGYLKEYGENYVHRFLVDTHAFHAPVIRDRHAPRYSRHVATSDEERLLFDALLGEHGVEHTDTL